MDGLAQQINNKESLELNKQRSQKVNEMTTMYNKHKKVQKLLNLRQILCFGVTKLLMFALI